MGSHKPSHSDAFGADAILHDGEAAPGIVPNEVPADVPAVAFHEVLLDALDADAVLHAKEAALGARRRPRRPIPPTRCSMPSTPMPCSEVLGAALEVDAVLDEEAASNAVPPEVEA